MRKARKPPEIADRQHDDRDDRVEKPRQRQPEYAATDVEHLAHELGLEPAPQLQEAQAGDHACRSGEQQEHVQDVDDRHGRPAVSSSTRKAP